MKPAEDGGLVSGFQAVRARNAWRREDSLEAGHPRNGPQPARAQTWNWNIHMRQRFTLDGGDALEEHLERVCACVLAAVRQAVPDKQLDALVLGGGYGRGEGGVLKTAHGERPYNDLEFYVFLRGHPLLNTRRYGPALHDLGGGLSVSAMVEVEFKILSLAQLRNSAPTMFYYDLLMGHRMLKGGEPLLAGCDHLRDATRIPPAEAARLLMNRCSGLLFSAEKLQREPFTDEDADFVGRNHAKAQLAFGDALLAACGQYHWSCLVRHRRLEQWNSPEAFPGLDAVRCLHAEGLRFKLHPRRTTASRDVLRAHQNELAAQALELWLWLENRRLGQAFSSARDYALSSLDKCPETHGLRNLLINARTFGVGGCPGKRGRRYPRERLFNALALLLWEPMALREPGLLDHIQRDLRTEARTFPDLVGAYAQLWRRFN